MDIKWYVKMSKLSRKFFVSISLVIIVVLMITLFLNANFIQRYYVYQKKIELKTIADKFMWNKLSYEQIKEIEEENGIIVVEMKNYTNLNQLNQVLYQAFLDKGMGLQKFWLWEEDYKSTLENGSQMRIYSQGKLNYSVMVQYMMQENHFIGVAVIIPNMQETIDMVNQLTVSIFAAAMLVLILLLYYLVKRITRPIEELGAFAVDISHQKFGKITLNTKDELEDLAEHLNDMSANLEQSQKELQQKNEQMQQLLGHVSHDLKTPIALIKVYADGMKDGMDDGSFLETIIRQNTVMEQITERLLSLSRFQQQKPELNIVNLSSLLSASVNTYQILLEKGNFLIQSQIIEDAQINGNTEAITSIFDNLLSNAIKYASSKTIKLKLKKEETQFFFCISNEIEENSGIDTEKVFEPFYVGERSRNKELSGTGLGLSIVQAIAQNYNYEYNCKIENNQFHFCIWFVISNN